MSKKNLIKLARITIPAYHFLYRITVDDSGNVGKENVRSVISRMQSRDEEKVVDRYVTANPFDVYVVFFDDDFKPCENSEVYLYNSSTNTYDPSGMEYESFINSDIGIKYINVLKNYNDVVHIDKLDINNGKILLKHGNDILTMTKLPFVSPVCKTLVSVKTSNRNILSEFDFANYLYNGNYDVYASYVPLPKNSAILLIYEEEFDITKEIFAETVIAFSNEKRLFRIDNFDCLNKIQKDFIMENAIPYEDFTRWNMEDNSIEIFFAK